MFEINGQAWQLAMVPPNFYKLYRPDGSLSVAACDYGDRTIYINATLKGHFLRKVLSHEITHAAMFSYNVNLTDAEEELVADLIATYGREIICITNEIFAKLRGAR